MGKYIMRYIFSYKHNIVYRDHHWYCLLARSYLVSLAFCEQFAKQDVSCLNSSLAVERRSQHSSRDARSHAFPGVCVCVCVFLCACVCVVCVHVCVCVFKPALQSQSLFMSTVLVVLLVLLVFIYSFCSFTQGLLKLRWIINSCSMNFRVALWSQLQQLFSYFK